jgi:hypothetical protein
MLNDGYELSENDLNEGGNAFEGATPGPGDGQAAASNVPDNQPTLHKYTAAGKEIEEPLDVVLKRASQGYHYAQNMQGLKKEREEFEKTVADREAQIRDMEQKWSPYENYAKENPDWAKHVQESWQNRTGFNGQQNGTQAGDFVLPEHVRQELDELRGFKDEFRGFQQSLRQEKEDLALKQQIDTVVKEYPDIDFSRTDPETGESLEFKVIEHAQANGIRNFRAAFRDFYHSELHNRAVTKAKEEAAKTIQERNREGFVGESLSTAKGLQTPQNLKNKSYFDLVQGPDIDALLNQT